MAEFDPENPGNPPSFLSYSQDILPKKPVGAAPAKQYAADTKATALAGVAVSGVAALDDFFAFRAEKETDKAARAVRDEALGIPDDLNKGFDSVGKLHKSYVNGQMSERQYYAKLQTTAQGLRNRWPGYKDVVDRTLSGIVGFDPANRIIQENYAAAAKAQGSVEAERKDYLNMVERATFAGYLDEGEAQYFVDRYNAGDPLPTSDLLKKVSKKTASKFKLEYIQAQIATAKANDENTARKEDRAAEVHFQQRFDSTMAPLEEEARRIVTSITSNGSREFSISDEQLQQGTAVALKAKAEIPNLVAQIAREYPDMTSEQRVKLIKEAEARVDTTLKLFSDGDINTLNAQKNLSDAMLASSGLDAIAKYPELRALSVIGNTAGPQAQQDAYAKNEELFNKTTSAVHNLILNKTMRDPPKKGESLTTATREMSEVLEDNGESPESVSQLALNLRDITTNGDAHLEGRIRAAEWLFGENNQEFLTTFANKDSKDPLINTDSQRQKLFAELAGGEMSATMIEIGKTRPDLLQNYNNWRDNSANALYRSDLNLLKGVNVDWKFKDLVFDDKTNKLKLVDREGVSPKQGDFPLSTPLQTFADTWEALGPGSDEVKHSIYRVNSVLTTLGQSWKAQGLDVNEESKKFLLNSAVTITPPATKPPTGLENSLFVLQNAIINSVGASSSSAPSEESPFKGMMRLGGPATPDLSNAYDNFKAVLDMEEISKALESVSPEAKASVARARDSLSKLKGTINESVVSTDTLTAEDRAIRNENPEFVGSQEQDVLLGQSVENPEEMSGIQEVGTGTSPEAPQLREIFDAISTIPWLQDAIEAGDIPDATLAAILTVIPGGKLLGKEGSRAAVKLIKGTQHYREAVQQAGADLAKLRLDKSSLEFKLSELPAGPSYQRAQLEQKISKLDENITTADTTYTKLFDEMVAEARASRSPSSRLRTTDELAAKLEKAKKELDESYRKKPSE